MQSSNLLGSTTRTQTILILFFLFFRVSKLQEDNIDIVSEDFFYGIFWNLSCIYIFFLSSFFLFFFLSIFRTQFKIPQGVNAFDYSERINLIGKLAQFVPGAQNVGKTERGVSKKNSEGVGYGVRERDFLLSPSLLSYQRVLDSETRKDYEYKIFSIPSSALARTNAILAGKRGSRRHSTTGCSTNIVVGETSYQILEV